MILYEVLNLALSLCSSCTPEEISLFQTNYSLLEVKSQQSFKQKLMFPCTLSDVLKSASNISNPDFLLSNLTQLNYTLLRQNHVSSIFKNNKVVFVRDYILDDLKKNLVSEFHVTLLKQSDLIMEFYMEHLPFFFKTNKYHHEIFNFKNEFWISPLFEKKIKSNAVLSLKEARVIVDSKHLRDFILRNQSGQLFPLQRNCFSQDTLFLPLFVIQNLHRQTAINVALSTQSSVFLDYIFQIWPKLKFQTSIFHELHQYEEISYKLLQSNESIDCILASSKNLVQNNDSCVGSLFLKLKTFDTDILLSNGIYLIFLNSEFVVLKSKYFGPFSPYHGMGVTYWEIMQNSLVQEYLFSKMIMENSAYFGTNGELMSLPNSLKNLKKYATNHVAVTETRTMEINEVVNWNEVVLVRREILKEMESNKILSFDSQKMLLDFEIVSKNMQNLFQSCLDKVFLTLDLEEKKVPFVETVSLQKIVYLDLKAQRLTTQCFLALLYSKVALKHFFLHLPIIQGPVKNQISNFSIIFEMNGSIDLFYEVLSLKNITTVSGRFKFKAYSFKSLEICDFLIGV